VGAVVQKIHAARLERFKKTLSKADFDTFMVSVGENRRYLSGFTAEDTQFDESAGVLFITDSRQILATDSRFTLQAESEASLFEVFRYKEGLVQALAEILNDLHTERLGFESDRVSYAVYRKLAEKLQSADLNVALIETADVVENLRVIKAESEIKSLKKALLIAELTFSGIVSELKAGMTEKEIAWILEKGMREAGAENLSFPSIVASGPNSALPHAIPGEREIRSGETLLFDWGAKLDGYCADISRTLFIGRPDQRFEKIYKTVYESQKMAIDAIGPGLSGKKVDQIARDHIAQNGFGDNFGHGLGHGTGLAVHESPRLSPIKDVKLEPGMVVTVEPGIYVSDWGGVRIENMVAVRENGAEVLNTLDTELITIEG